MKRLYAILCCAALGCVGTPAHPHEPSLATLQRTAAARPHDLKAQRDLAFGELLAPGGDAKRAEAALVNARRLAPPQADVMFGQGMLMDMHGHPEAALDAYLDTIELAARDNRPDGQALIEAASYAVIGQSGLVKGYVDRVSERVLPLLETPRLSLAARAALSDVMIPLTLRRGDPAASARIAEHLGCVKQLRVAGPFGPRELLGFDSGWPVDVHQPLLPSYDLGPGRGTRPTRLSQAQACSLHLGGGEIAEAGTTVAEGAIEIEQAGRYLLRLDTPNSVELLIDGQTALRVDRRKQLGSRVVFQALTLSPGRHRLLVRVSSRHPNPVLELAIAPYRRVDEETLSLHTLHRDEPGFGLYLRAAIGLARGDVLSARQALAETTRTRDASPVLLLQRAAAALSDPLVPDGVRGDEARRYLTQATQRDGALWAPVLQLAALAAKAGRVKESIVVLREAEVRWPEVPAIGLALADLLRSKHFNAAADRTLARVREAVPDACLPMGVQLDALRSRQRYSEALQLAEQLVKCDAESNALYTMYLERRDYAAAGRELDRLSRLQPDSGRYANLVAQLNLAKNAGDDKQVASTIHELRVRYPRAYSGAIEAIDRENAAGRSNEALAELNEATHAEPTAMAGLHRVGKVLGQQHPLEPYRRDGLAAIKAFEASGRKYDGPQVLVLDYMAVRVFDDGSSLELVHTVQKAQSDEAVDQLGEVEVPDGAQVLTLRGIKPDGRRLEADNISGKSSVSLPNFAPGDYVEFEYLQASAPSEGFPAGYLGDRFYFESFEVPFDHSEMVVILPTQMKYEVDPRGDAPKAEQKLLGDLRELRFHVDQSLPLSEEPNSVAVREFIPSVRIGVNATFPTLVESLRDVLSDRDLFDPYYAQLTREIVGDAAATDYRLRAERLYGWVLANIENSNEVFSQAALMLRAKAGNRARVLNYLLGLAGVPTQLALARSYGSDSVVSDMADADTYDHLLIRVDTKPEPIWLFTNERWAPFGFMPAALRGQPALLMAAGAPSVKVGPGTLGPDSRRFVVNATLAADGGAKLDVNETLHGSEAVAWRGQLEQIPQAELEHRMEQDYAARLFPGASLSKLEISGREQEKPDLTLHYVLDIRSFARQVPEGLALPAVLESEVAANLARTATRKTTELIASPLHTDVTLTIQLPNGFQLAGKPEPQNLVGAFAGRPSFGNRISSDQGALKIERSLSLPAMRVLPQDYPAFAEFCRRVDEVEGQELLLRAAH
jgi:tetratricopeptide (TPR) repeat protein